MKLPSIDGCPGCSQQADELYRGTSRIQQRPITQSRNISRSIEQSALKRVSVYDQLGPVCSEE